MLKIAEMLKIIITEINYIFKYINIENILNCSNISQYSCFYCFFNQKYPALMSILDWLQKHVLTPHLWM